MAGVGPHTWTEYAWKTEVGEFRLEIGDDGYWIQEFAPSMPPEEGNRWWYSNGNCLTTKDCCRVFPSKGVACDEVDATIARRRARAAGALSPEQLSAFDLDAKAFTIPVERNEGGVELCEEMMRRTMEASGPCCSDPCCEETRTPEVRRAVRELAEAVDLVMVDVIEMRGRLRSVLGGSSSEPIKDEVDVPNPVHLWTEIDAQTAYAMKVHESIVALLQELEL